MLNEDAELVAARDIEMVGEVAGEIEDYEFVKGAKDATYFNKAFATIEVTEESLPADGEKGGQQSARG